MATYSTPNMFSSSARGEGDICREFSFILPIAVLAEFFRLPEGNARRIRIVGSEFNMALQRRDDENVRKYSDELYGIAREVIEDRKAAPQDPDVDPISSVLAVRIDGSKYAILISICSMEVQSDYHLRREPSGYRSR